MKKSIIIIGLTLFTCSGLMAQEANTPEIHSKEYVVSKTNEFSTFYSLDESGRQKAMRAVYDNNLKEIELESKMSQMSSEELREAKKNLVIELETNLKVLVTETQWLKFEELKKTSVYY